MKKLCLLFFSLITLSSWAGPGGEEKQAIAVQVVDADTGLPLIGASVKIAATGQTLFTDPDGMLELSYADKEEIAISVDYISYQAVSHTIHKGIASEYRVALHSH